jgi:hypothetical protein
MLALFGVAFFSMHPLDGWAFSFVPQEVEVSGVQ